MTQFELKKNPCFSNLFVERRPFNILSVSPFHRLLISCFVHNFVSSHDTNIKPIRIPLCYLNNKLLLFHKSHSLGAGFAADRRN